MSLIYIYRLGTFVLTMIAAIVVLALSVESTQAANEIKQQLKAAGARFNIGSTMDYAHLGIAIGAFTLLSLPVMLVLDFVKLGAIRATVVVELGWLSFLWLLWIVTAAVTFSKADYRVLPSCSLLKPIDQLVTICKFSQPIGVISAIAAALLFLYCAVLLVTSAKQAGPGRSPWGKSVKDAEKA